MIALEYGQQKEDVMLFLHGGGLSWWNYRDEIKLLEKEFHLVIPILDGHGGSDREFMSIEENAEEIIDFIDKKYGGRVLLIGGLSLGGQILLEILSQRKDISKFAIVESALAIPMKTTFKLIRPAYGICYGLIEKQWFAKLQFQSLKMKEDLFEDYYKDICKISKNSLIAFLEANSSYQIKPSLKESQAKTVVLAGSRERDIILKSAKEICKALPGSRLEILEGCSHGDISINHPEEYVKKIYELLNREKRMSHAPS